MPRSSDAQTAARLDAAESWIEELAEAVATLAKRTGHPTVSVPLEPPPVRLDPDPRTLGPRRRRTTGKC